jgi:membrane protease subunit HflK
VLYQVRDPEGLVRATARWALQEAVGSQSIDSLLTVGRGGIEGQVRTELMQPALDACASGLRVVDVRLASVHAPTPVHWAFRDVAGAAEDAAQYVNMAHEYAERVVREAMGDSARGVALAHGQAVERVARASGEASSFELLNAEQRRAPALTKSRLRLEQLEKVLPRLRLYVDLTDGRGQGPDVWLRRGQGFEALPFGGLAPRGAANRETPRSPEENK